MENPSLPIILLGVVLFHFFHGHARALHGQLTPANLKIEIRKIKESGSSPFWSPDGKEIVYVDRGGLYIISADGSGKV